MYFFINGEKIEPYIYQDSIKLTLTSKDNSFKNLSEWVVFEVEYLDSTSFIRGFYDRSGYAATHIRVFIKSDGTLYVTPTRDGKPLLEWRNNPEGGFEFGWPEEFTSIISDALWHYRVTISWAIKGRTRYGLETLNIRQSSLTRLMSYLGVPEEKEISSWADKVDSMSFRKDISMELESPSFNPEKEVLVWCRIYPTKRISAFFIEKDKLYSN